MSVTKNHDRVQRFPFESHMTGLSALAGPAPASLIRLIEVGHFPFSVSVVRRHVAQAAVWLIWPSRRHVCLQTERGASVLPV